MSVLSVMKNYTFILTFRTISKLQYLGYHTISNYSSHYCVVTFRTISKHSTQMYNVYSHRHVHFSFHCICHLCTKAKGWSFVRLLPGQFLSWHIAELQRMLPQRENNYVLMLALKSSPRFILNTYWFVSIWLVLAASRFNQLQNLPSTVPPKKF